MIRIATPNDFDEVLSMFLFGAKEYNREYDQEHVELVVKSFLDNSSVVLYEVSGIIAGLCAWAVGIDKLSGKTVLKKEVFYVKPDYRLGKAALMLMDFMLKLSDRISASRIVFSGIIGASFVNVEKMLLSKEFLPIEVVFERGV